MGDLSVFRTKGNLEFVQKRKKEISISQDYVHKFYESDLNNWRTKVKKIKQKNKRLEKEYKQKLSKWEEDYYSNCKSSIQRFFKKIFEIFSKPRLKLLKIPPEPKWDYKKYEKEVLQEKEKFK